MVIQNTAGPVERQDRDWTTHKPGVDLPAVREQQTTVVLDPPRRQGSDEPGEKSVTDCEPKTKGPNAGIVFNVDAGHSLSAVRPTPTIRDGRTFNAPSEATQEWW